MEEQAVVDAEEDGVEEEGEEAAVSIMPTNTRVIITNRINNNPFPQVATLPAAAAAASPGFELRQQRKLLRKAIARVVSHWRP